MGIRSRRVAGTLTTVAAWSLFTVMLVACSNFHPDPTDDSNYSWITIKNDTNQLVDLLDCVESGRDCYRVATVDPGDTADLRVQWGDGVSQFEVRHGDAAPGWLTVQSKQRESGSIYYTSDSSTGLNTMAPDHGHPVPFH
jgi:hypothetical protein